jgi:hypothetical protein
MVFVQVDAQLRCRVVHGVRQMWGSERFEVSEFSISIFWIFLKSAG